jgi:hypothetical protein
MEAYKNARTKVDPAVNWAMSYKRRPYDSQRQKGEPEEEWRVSRGVRSKPPEIHITPGGATKDPEVKW